MESNQPDTTDVLEEVKETSSGDAPVSGVPEKSTSGFVESLYFTYRSALIGILGSFGSRYSIFFTATKLFC